MKVLEIKDGKFVWVDAPATKDVTADDYCHNCEARTQWTDKDDWTFCGSCGSADYIGPLDPSE